jgi:hypothetical protein
MRSADPPAIEDTDHLQDRAYNETSLAGFLRKKTWLDGPEDDVRAIVQVVSVLLAGQRGVADRLAEPAREERRPDGALLRPRRRRRARDRWAGARCAPLAR